MRRSTLPRPGATALKVSHSLPPKIVERLKELAYWERVSESSIIEFLLTEFFALADNATLGRIVKGSNMTHRRDRAAKAGAAHDGASLMERLTEARHAFASAVDEWKAQPCRARLNAAELARLELAATRAKIEQNGMSLDLSGAGPTGAAS